MATYGSIRDRRNGQHRTLPYGKQGSTTRSFFVRLFFGSRIFGQCTSVSFFNATCRRCRGTCYLTRRHNTTHSTSSRFGCGCGCKIGRGVRRSTHHGTCRPICHTTLGTGLVVGRGQTRRGQHSTRGMGGVLLYVQRGNVN